jgi:hypothetical protein
VVQLEKELALQTSPSKEESKSKDNSGSSFTNAHPCFSFLKNIDNIKLADLKAKSGFKYRMQHPYSYQPFEIEAKLKLCTIH